MKIEIIFYSMFGHVYRMAEAVAEGAREVEGAEAELYQVPELVPEAILEKSGAKAARQVFSRVPTASACPPRTSSPLPGSRAGTWLKSPGLF
jgi:NAD(P)H dehydrogenase (quinone)